MEKLLPKPTTQAASWVASPMECPFCLPLRSKPHHPFPALREKGLYLGSAPDTFMGAAWQKGAQILAGNTLATVTGFDVYVNRNMDQIANEYPFVRLAGGGVLYDYGVYHLTALTFLLGRVKEVCAIVENNKPVRIGTVEGTPDFGKEYAFPNEAQASAMRNAVSKSMV